MSRQGDRQGWCRAGNRLLPRGSSSPAPCPRAQKAAARLVPGSTRCRLGRHGPRFNQEQATLSFKPMLQPGTPLPVRFHHPPPPKGTPVPDATLGGWGRICRAARVLVPVMLWTEVAPGSQSHEGHRQSRSTVAVGEGTALTGEQWPGMLRHRRPPRLGRRAGRQRAELRSR